MYDYGLDNIDSNIGYLYDLRTSRCELSSKGKDINWDSTKEIEVDDLLKSMKEDGVNDKFVNSRYKKQKYSVDDIKLLFFQKKSIKRNMLSILGKL